MNPADNNSSKLEAQYSWKAMGTDWSIYTQDEMSPIQYSQIVLQVEYFENLWSRFRDTSELSFLNQNSGTWTKVSPQTRELLQACLYWYQQTQGVFNPMMGNSMDIIGYEKSLTVQAPNPAGLPELQFNPEIFQLHEDFIMIPKGLKLDLGGIAKSWSACKLAYMIYHNFQTPVLVNAGGDIQLVGCDCEVKVADTGTSVILLDGQGIATSSTLKRQWKAQDGTSIHHLLDPSKGNLSPQGQISVVGQNAVEADVLAKYYLIKPELFVSAPSCAYRSYPTVEPNQKWSVTYPLLEASQVLKEDKLLANQELSTDASAQQNKSDLSSVTDDQPNKAELKSTKGTANVKKAPPTKRKVNRAKSLSKPIKIATVCMALTIPLLAWGIYQQRDILNPRSQGDNLALVSNRYNALLDKKYQKIKALAKDDPELQNQLEVLQKTLKSGKKPSKEVEKQIRAIEKKINKKISRKELIASSPNNKSSNSRNSSKNSSNNSVKHSTSNRNNSSNSNNSNSNNSSSNNSTSNNSTSQSDPTPTTQSDPTPTTQSDPAPTTSNNSTSQPPTTQAS